MLKLSSFHKLGISCNFARDAANHIRLTLVNVLTFTLASHFEDVSIRIGFGFDLGFLIAATRTIPGRARAANLSGEIGFRFVHS